jgi:hypothetical protein
MHEVPIPRGSDAAARAPADGIWPVKMRLALDDSMIVWPVSLRITDSQFDPYSSQFDTY